MSRSRVSDLVWAVRVQKTGKFLMDNRGDEGFGFFARDWLEVDLGEATLFDLSPTLWDFSESYEDHQLEVVRVRRTLTVLYTK